MARTPRLVQRALDALSGSKFFVGLAERALIADLKQVHAYLADQQVRVEVLSRVTQAVKSDTGVLIGHSLGSVVAYEALCAHPEWPIHTLITLGSPLGIRNLIFGARLHPPPERGIGSWPGSVQRWCNIADGGDVVALEKRLECRFGDRVEDILIYNGASAHDVSRYLTAKETGRVLATALSQ
jgi:pimeloyl-ACP methyl ester carboxylesterase